MARSSSSTRRPHNDDAPRSPAGIPTDGSGRRIRAATVADTLGRRYPVDTVADDVGRQVSGNILADHLSIQTRSVHAMSRSWSTVTVGVADLAVARRLWVGQFGMHVVAERQGSDSALATLWQIAPERIRAQLLLATPGQRHGQLHLVEFCEPAPPVREGARVFDRVAKNLDIYVDDMPARVAELKAAGYRFRNDDYSEVTAPDGVRFREIHLPAHDALNVVLLEVLGETKPLTARGYGAVGPLITIVPDALAEQAFAAHVLGLSPISQNLLDGEEIERMIGLPAGAALDVSIWGDPGDPFGELEIIEYRGTAGDNLYPRAHAPATGILQLRYHVEALAPLVRRLREHDIAAAVYEAKTLIDGHGAVCVFHSPAGLRIEALETGLR